MEVVLAELARMICLVYLDDVVVLGRTLDEHNTNLAQVLKRLREAGLRLKPNTCSFAMREIVYLGDVVSGEGIRTAPSKLEAVKQYLVPKDVKSLRSFLGPISYYRRFIPGFSASPPSCTDKERRPLQLDGRIPASILRTQKTAHRYASARFPQFHETIHLGDGCIRIRPGSCRHTGTGRWHTKTRLPTLNTECTPVTELEGLGVVPAVKHFRAYLYGHRCKVYTDHEALKALLNTPQPSEKLARWGMAIQELDLLIHVLYRSSKHNENAHALSRFPLVSEGKPTATIADQVVAAVNPVDPDTLPFLTS